MPRTDAKRTTAATLLLTVAWITIGGSLVSHASTGRGASSEPASVLKDPVGRQAGISPAWLDRVARGLAEREYGASIDGSRLQAPNRRHNLRTVFEPSGIRVHDRTATGSPRLLGLSLVGLGRGRGLAPVSPGRVVRNGGRVEIERPGIVEWYVNAASGLEQGFELSARPVGSGALVLELAVEDATATLAGDRVILSTATGRRLAYEALAVVDAKGERVEARLEVRDSRSVQIVVADAAAAYPLTIDPLLGELVAAQIESNQAAAQLGISVSGAGDVDGDGHADVIVGARFFDAGQVNEGAAFVFLGGASGIASGDVSSASAQLEADQADADMGYSVAGAGDVNGDGYSDVIVGARFFNGGLYREGAAFVFLGSASGIPDGSPATASARLESNQEFAMLGASVAGAGDVNGDGYDDVLVGANLYGSGQSEEGAAFIFHGGPLGITNGNPASAATRLESNQANAELGTSVSSAGDVNGDGYADVIVGAPIYDTFAPFSHAGAAFVFHGGASGVADGNPANAAARLESDANSASFGSSVSGAGDVNGDGFADVIVGDTGYFPAPGFGGGAFVFLGSTSGVADATPAFADSELLGDQPGASMGFRVSSAGDFDGDGYADVVVGASGYDDGLGHVGVAFVYPGSATGVARGDPETAMALLANGSRASGAGDVDGDGFADILVGKPSHASGETGEGAVFLYRGRGDGVHPARLRQRRADGSQVFVLPGGAVRASDRFAVDFFAIRPPGLDVARLEVELCGSGIPFGDPACSTHVAPSWSALAADGSLLSTTISGLSANVRYSWRARTAHAASPVGASTSVVHGPWYRLQGRATPGDVRTVPEPGLELGLVIGIAGLASRRLRRRPTSG